MTDSTTQDTNHTLDAREIEGEPFDDIMAALDDLPVGDRLLLVNSFEPVPLYQVLENRGFTYDAEKVGDAEWHIIVEHAD